MLAGVLHREGPFGAKGIEEEVMVVYPPAVSNAIYNAIGVRINEIPIISENILIAIREKGGKKILGRNVKVEREHRGK